MKKFVKNKKVLISITSVLMLAILVGGSIFLFKENTKDTENNNQNSTSNYVAYIKINPSIKLEYQQICKNDKCDEPIVLKYELVNDDAKNIFKDIDLLQNDKTLYKVIDLITEITKNNNIKFDKVEIYSDWNNAQAYLNETSKNKDIFKVSINTNDELKEISNLLIKNENIPDEMFVPSKDELPEGAHYATKEEAEKYGIPEGTIIYPTESMKEFVQPERTEEQLQKEYEYYYGNKKQENNSQESNPQKKDEEFTSQKDLGNGFVKEEAEGYGDYIVETEKWVGETMYLNVTEKSKLGCKDAIDKHACKESWMEYFALKMGGNFTGVFVKDTSNLDNYLEQANRYLPKYDFYKTGVERCKVDREGTEADIASGYYTGFCDDAPGYLEYIQTIKDNHEKTIQYWTDFMNAAEAHYNELYKAWSLYKNLPY